MPFPASFTLLRASILTLLGALAFLFSACSSTPSSVVDWTIAGTKWNVVELDGEMVPLEKIPTLQLDPNSTRVVAFGAVNQLSGTYELKAGHGGGNLTFGPMVSTKMAGPPNQMKVEEHFLQMLGSVTGYHIAGPWLALMAGDKTVARAQALPAAPLPPK
jgi:heat shock protein HslJ